MGIRLVIFDLDDTLLRDDLAIGERTLEAIRRAQRADVMVTAASGRMYPSMRPYVEQMGIRLPVLACQGALIIDPVKGKELYRCPVPLDLAHRVVEAMDERGVYLQTYGDEEFFFERESEFSDLYRYYSRVDGRAVGPLKEFIREPPVKLLAIDKPERIAALEPEMQALFGNALEIARSKAMYLEFTHPAANKGDGLKTLACMLGVMPEEIMAIGDGHNDLPMIRYAGIGVAVANASERVRREADFVTASNMDDGVAQAIERWALEG